MGNEQSDVTADWMLFQRLFEHAKGASASSVGNLINAALVCVVFNSNINWGLLAAGYALIVIIIAHRLWSNRKTTASNTLNANQLTYINRHIEANALALGLWWGVVVGGLVSMATPDQHMFLGIIGSGMMGAGTITYRVLTRAGVLFVGICGFGSLIGLLTIGTSSAYAACGLLVSYLMILLRAIKQGAESFDLSNVRERALSESSETIRLLLNDYEENGSDWLIEIDQNGLIINPCARLSDAAGRPLETLDRMSLADLLCDTAERGILMNAILKGVPFRGLQVSISVESEQRWWSITAHPSSQSGQGYRGVVTDITIQRLAETKVNYMAHYDGLTELPNRFLFNENLHRALERQVQGVGLMYIDLDYFKSVNDTLGHPVGDKLLKSVARRLEACVRSGDIIARLGGDEFAILVGGQSLTTIHELAARIIDAIALPFSLDGYDVTTGASIGIACAPDHGNTAEKLLQNADLALYAAKAEGRSRFAQFEQGMDSAAQTRRMLELDLRSALARDEMRLYFQPLINVVTGEPVAYEALVRWEHHSRGIVMPNDFISIAEETGMVIKIGEWVIRRAIDQAALWPDHISVSVNLSPAQMRSTNLLPTVINALANSGVAPNRLEFEITESVLMHDSEANLAILRKLSEIGVRIALDDFGTGYSSLNYLRSFPFDKIKIDRCFIEEIDSRDDCRAIVRSIVSLADSLGMVTTAEGVERESQMVELRREGCTEVQGFLFSKAVPPEELTDLRRANDQRRAA